MSGEMVRIIESQTKQGNFKTNTMSDNQQVNRKRLLWAGFVAILAAGVGFGIRGGIFANWASDFGFSGAQLGAIGGAGGAGIQAISRNFRPLVQDGAIDQARKAVKRGSGYITRGQAIGGVSKKVEDSLGNVMPSIKAAQTEGLKGSVSYTHLRAHET